MSVNDPDPHAPFIPGTPLARALDAFCAPDLPAGFAERVIAAAEARPAPLPELRRASGGRGWRFGRRLAIGLAGFGALATAAAATGVLEQFDLPVPSAETVWAGITGKPPAPAPAAVPEPVIAAASDTDAPAPVAITGPIDTPEELAEAFRRIEAVREGRFAARAERIDRRIDTAIERRRAAGEPVPTAEQEAQLRARIEARETRRRQIVDERLAAQREALQRKVESGAAVTREDIVTPLRAEGLPGARREALRRLPPEERRALIEAWRAGRASMLSPVEPSAPVSEPPADN